MPLRDRPDTARSTESSVVQRGSDGANYPERFLHWLNRYERELWFVTISAMLMDVTLTVHGLQLGLRELNPVARAALDVAGAVGLYGLKGVALLLGGICIQLIPTKYTALVPLGLAIPSTIAVVINSTLILYVV